MRGRGKISLGLPGAVAAALIMLQALTLASEAGSLLSFYKAADAQLAGPPGTLIRRELFRGAPDGTIAYRILYRSTGLDGRPIAVSGAVIIPKTPPPPGGWPVVAWAHPTSGVVPRCAPSLALFLFQQIQGLRDMVRRGYVIAATDYPGLGTPRPHPYLVGVSEARAVLDSVRAARQLLGIGGANRFTVWGHSQGGHAALFTGLLAKSYAPDLQLVGVAAAAPATELAILFEDDIGSAGGNGLVAMTLWSWARVFGAPLDPVIDPSAMPTINRLAGICIESIFDIAVRRQIERPLEHDFLRVRKLDEIAPWRSLLALNTPGALPPDVPIFIAQGLLDRLVRPEVTRNYMMHLCKNGSRVKMFIMPKTNHGFAARDSAEAAVGWTANRFAGLPPPNDCEALETNGKLD